VGVDDRRARWWSEVRADLHDLLAARARAFDADVVRLNRRVTGFTESADGVELRFADGSSAQGDLLIGADGLWSNIRKQVVVDGPPRVSGHTTYRSVIPTDQMPEDLRWNAATLWAGPKCHLVHYPLSGWKVFNLVVTCHNDAPEPVAGKPVSDDEVMRGFAHVHERAQAIIRHGKNWRLWVLCDRDPTENWVDGRVALLGDAAHPMLQYFAQGACQAMEDAVCLSHMLSAHPDDYATALENYRRQRFPRTARVQMLSRVIGALRSGLCLPSASNQPIWPRRATITVTPGTVPLSISRLNASDIRCSRIDDRPSDSGLACGSGGVCGAGACFAAACGVMVSPFFLVVRRFGNGWVKSGAEHPD